MLGVATSTVALISFMAVMNEMMNTLATIGAMSGMVIRRAVSIGVAPLTIDANAFKTASGDLEGSLRLICEKVHGYGDVEVGG